MPAFKLKIALRGSNPKITRTIAVPTDLTFADLHRVFQAAMPWSDYHMHEFRFPGLRIRVVQERSDSFFSREREELEDDLHIADFHGMKFQYIYDFGDDWIHDVTWLKDIQDYDDDHPRVLKYTEEAPPEDCGGIAGYYGMLDILGDPGHPEHDSMAEWYGEPEPYDIDDVNRYFACSWTRAASGVRVAPGVMDDIAYVLGSPTLAAYAYDRARGEVVCVGAGDGEFDIAEPEAVQDEGRLIHIRPKVNKGLFDRCADFCEQMTAEGHRGFEGQRCASKRDFDLIRRKAVKAGSEERFERFMADYGYDMADAWARDNGVVIGDSPSPFFGSDEEEPDMETFLGAMSALRTDMKISGQEFMCPGCGRMLAAKVDFSIMGMRLRGNPVFPVSIDCHGCRRKTLLAEMNDGFSLGFDYMGMGVPQRMGERIIRATLDAEGLEGPARAMRLADAAQEYLEFRKTDEASRILEEASSCFDGPPEDQAGFDAYQRVLALVSEVDPGRIPPEAHGVEDRMHGDFGALLLANMGCEEEDPAEGARLSAMSEAASDGSDAWAGLRAAGSRIRRRDGMPDGEAVAAMRALFDRYMEAIGADDRRLGLKSDMVSLFEAMEDLAFDSGEGIPGRDPADILLERYPEQRMGVNAIRCVALLRRALNRLDSGAEGGLEDAEELVRTVLDNYDLGPYTAARCCYAELLAYWYGGRDTTRLEKALEVFSAIVRSNRADEDLVNEFANCFIMAGTPDLGEDRVREMLKGHGVEILSSVPDQSTMSEFDADLVLSLYSPFYS